MGVLPPTPGHRSAAAAGSATTVVSVEQVHAVEAGQEAFAHGRPGDDGCDGTFEHALEQRRRGLGEASVEALRGDGAPDGGGGVGEAGERRVGVVEPSEDEGLDESGGGERALSLDEAGGAGEAVGGGGEDLPEGVGQAR